MDPLIGSSNIDVNVSVGTTCFTEGLHAIGTVTIEDFYNLGLIQVAAGYVIYGTSTMIVSESRCKWFTLRNPAIGTFYLSRTNIQFFQRMIFVLLMKVICSFPSRGEKLLSTVSLRKATGHILLVILEV
jgi:fructose-1,6-bisphosphatase